MKIIVANKAEEALARKLFNVIYEFDVLDHMHNLTTESLSDGDDGEFIIYADETSILREELQEIQIVIDDKQSDIMVEGELVTGICRFCGLDTVGIGEDCDGCAYEDYVDYKSEERQKNWTCSECARRVCECCDEKLTDSDDESECADCLKQSMEAVSNDKG